MVRPLGVLGLGLLVLQGCAELREWTAGAEAPAPPVPARKPAVEEPAAKEQAVTEQAATEEAVAVEQQAAAPTATEVEDGQPVIGDLVGLDFAEVRALLGAPSLEEIQPPATIWAYNGRGCVLSVFFYPHVDGGNFRALTYDVKGAEQTPELPQRCFADLVQEESKAGAK
jgi:hypothetical protein